MYIIYLLVAVGQQKLLPKILKQLAGVGVVVGTGLGAVDIKGVGVGLTHLAFIQAVRASATHSASDLQMLGLPKT